MSPWEQERLKSGPLWIFTERTHSPKIVLNKTELTHILSAQLLILETIHIVKMLAQQ